MLRRLLCIALLCISIAAAKTWSFSLSDITKAGDGTLEPGKYTVELNGSNVILRDSRGHRASAAPRIETSDKKFKDTVVQISHSNGINRIEWIGLGGSQFRIVFGNDAAGAGR